MKINNIEIKPIENSINPELIFETEIFINQGKEIPFLITGCIFSVDNKKIANIKETYFKENFFINLTARSIGQPEEKAILVKLIAPLNKNALDYIHSLREINPIGDINLKIEIYVKAIISKTTISHMFLLERNIPTELSDFYGDTLPIAYKYQERFTSSRTNMWILSGDSGPDFIEIRNFLFKKNIIIKSSDWIHRYCPIFEIGKFMVFEFFMPDYIEGSETIEERLNDSINSVKKMEEYLIKGEWNSVIEVSRKVSELLRNQDEVKDILMRDGYTEEAFEELNESIRNLFRFASKFIHRLDQNGRRIMPEIKASKEDAYLIYALSTNIINLISKKIQRLES